MTHRLSHLLLLTAAAFLALCAPSAGACSLIAYVNGGEGLNIDTYDGNDGICWATFGSYYVSGDAGTVISCNGSSSSCKVQFSDFQQEGCPDLNVPCNYDVVIGSATDPMGTTCTQPIGGKNCSINPRFGARQLRGGSSLPFP